MSGLVARVLVALLPCLLALAGAAVEDPEQRPPAATTRPGLPAPLPLSAPVELRLAPYVGLLRTVTVRLGTRELPFLFDTGGGATVLSLATARAVGALPFGRGTGFRHDGTRSDGQRAGPLALAIGPFVRTDEVGVFDVDGLLQGLPPVGGIVSLETFARQPVTLDLGGDRLILESAQSLAERSARARELMVRLGRQAAGMALDVFVAVRGRHGPLWFELDSGNVAPVLIAPHAFAELGIKAPPADKGVEVTLEVSGLGAVSCTAVTKELIYDGLLNAEFCRRYLLTFDLEHARAWARPR